MSSPFLTIPRARSMIWPGSQQTMGELLDQDKLTCKMLRQASAKAENEQVRKAAEVLLVDRERKIREYIDGGNLPRNIDEAVADDSNPIKQARRNAAALKEFLDPDFNRNREHAFVEPIVVWANPEIKVYRKKPADSQDPHSQETKCWRIEDLSFELDSIRCKKHLSEKAQREIIKKLESCY